MRADRLEMECATACCGPKYRLGISMFSEDRPLSESQ